MLDWMKFIATAFYFLEEALPPISGFLKRKALTPRSDAMVRNFNSKTVNEGGLKGFFTQNVKKRPVLGVL